tara:strand:+ start:7776 stop:8900 length:1125 start_codon:yes stop_codon:yes gene_type:complete
MIVECTGTAILEDNLSGQRFSIEHDELDWAVVDAQDRPMGLEYHYQATIEHDVLGALAWNLWEYPLGIQNYNTTEVGQARIIQDFEYSLDHDDDRDLEDLFDPSEVASKEEWADLTESEQIERMVFWFNRMFEDPQNQTPYAADKDSPYNYEYIWGGPYDASEELSDQFSGIASEEAIEKAVEIVQDQDGIYEWAPSDAHPNMRRRAEEAMAEHAEQADQLPSLGEVRQQIRETPRLQLGTPEELEARQELLSLIQDFAPLVARATETPAHGGMGHNQPPPEMTLPQHIGVSISVNINAIQTEVSSDTPDVEAMAEATSALQKVGEEVSDFFRMTKDQVKSLGSKALAGAIVGGIGTLVYKAVTWLALVLGFPL